MGIVQAETVGSETQFPVVVFLNFERKLDLQVQLLKS